VGKIAIPDLILKKPGKLSPEEYVEMQKHTIHGEKILSNTQFFKIAREISRWHHEKFDGTGYPDGLVEYAIPFHARVTSVADVYDALTNIRIYKEAWSEEKAFTHILQRVGTDFDPLVIEAFEKLYKSGIITKIRGKYN
jgi:putative two-component system response regulator